MAKIKICGLRRQEDISFANQLMPDYVGFILSGGYRRSVDVATVVGLTENLAKGIKKVGVFVNEPVDNINYAVSQGAVDIVQLHGNESVDFCKKINAPVIKVLKPNDFDKIDDYVPYVDYLLFDSGAGTGKTFDWGKIPKCEKPFFLAGGLDEGNLQQAIKIVNPYAVDMSSSVETDGVKDYNKMKKIIDIVRRTENE